MLLLIAVAKVLSFFDYTKYFKIFISLGLIHRYSFMLLGIF